MPDCKDLMKNAAPIIFGLIIFGLLSYSLQILTHTEIPAANRDLIIQIIETIKNAALIVVGFLYGTSASEKAKSETISQIATASPAANNTLPAAPITIPGADKVTVSTAAGDINIPTQLPKEDL